MALPRILDIAAGVFRMRNAELPIQLTLLAKLFAIIFVAKFGWRWFGPPFLPFIPFFDEIAYPGLWHRGLQLTALGCAAMILLNQRIRLACFVFGLTVFVGILSARLSYSNNRLLLACVLLLIGLYRPGQRFDYLRLQMALLYFGAAFNKILDPDWRSGVFFENWSSVLGHTWYANLATLFPPLTLSMLVCWAVIVIEFILTAAWCSGRYRLPLIWVGVPFHFALSFYHGASFGMFFHLAPACYLILAEWPKELIQVRYAGEHKSLNRVRRFFERIDFDGFFHWVPVKQDANVHHPGADCQSVPEGLVVRAGEKDETGFRALRLLVLYSPITWLVLCVLLLIVTPKGMLTVASYGLCIGGLLVFSRLFDPVGARLFNGMVDRPGRLATESHDR